jgi:hypothetical protein
MKNAGASFVITTLGKGSLIDRMTAEAQARRDEFQMNEQCKHCRHVQVIWRPTGQHEIQWCLLHGRVAHVPCKSYEREPGADDE